MLASVFMPLGAGLLAGIHHAVSGPDHLAGVAPFAARAGRRAGRVGVRWGLGHAAGASLAALLALALRARVPGLEQRLSGLSEVGVGIALVVIGALGLNAAVRRHHRHGHGPGREPGAVEAPGREHDHGHAGGPGLAHPRAAFWLGVLHGAAGLSHLFAVLPALAFPGWLAPLLYLGGYAGGSLAAIAGFTAALGRLLPGRSERALRLSLGAASAVSLVVGALWITHSA